MPRRLRWQSASWISTALALCSSVAIERSKADSSSSHERPVESIVRTRCASPETLPDRAAVAAFTDVGGFVDEHKVLPDIEHLAAASVQLICASTEGLSRDRSRAWWRGETDRRRV